MFIDSKNELQEPGRWSITYQPPDWDDEWRAKGVVYGIQVIPRSITCDWHFKRNHDCTSSNYSCFRNTHRYQKDLHIVVVPHRSLPDHQLFSHLEKKIVWKQLFPTGVLLGYGSYLTIKYYTLHSVPATVNPEGNTVWITWISSNGNIRFHWTQ